MPQPYPQASFNTTTGLFEYANTVTDGWMMILFLVAAYVIIFVTMKVRDYRTSDSFLTASLLCLVLGSFLWGATLIAGKIMIILLAMTALSAIYSVFDSN